MKKALIITGFIILVVLIGGLIFINKALITDSEEKMDQLQAKGIQVKSEQLNTPLGELHYTQCGKPTGTPIILIHGSPGSWDNWLEVQGDARLNRHFYMYSVDRAGFGLTTIPHQPHLKSQSEALLPLLETIDQPVILIGHSYGAAVAQQIALDYPNRVSKLIYVAGTLDPQAQRPKWYNRLANTRILSWVLADYWNASSQEMTNLSEDLLKNERSLIDLNIPTFLIQGEKDILVPFSTVDYYKDISNDRVHYILDQDENHFIPWTKPSLIINLLLELKK